MTTLDTVSTLFDPKYIGQINGACHEWRRVVGGKLGEMTLVFVPLNEHGEAIIEGGKPLEFAVPSFDFVSEKFGCEGEVFVSGNKIGINFKSDTE